jgi:hypothetical protein
MSNVKTSLLAGRNKAPLTQDEVRRAINTFLGLDGNVNVRHEAESVTAFRISRDASGTYGEIVFGPDIYPGSSVVDPNSVLSLDAAAAHALTHYYRWKDKVALSEDKLGHLDEALTSLQAVLRYSRQLNETDIRQLVSDACQRLQLFISDQI